MSSRSILSPLACVFLLAACAPADAPVDTAAIQAEVAQAMADYREAVLTGNIDAAIGRLTADVHVREPGMNVRGTEAHDTFRGILESATFQSFDTRPGDYFVHGDDVAYEVGEYDELIIIGGDTTTVAGFYFIRWEKGDDGQWRFDRIVAGPREAPE